MGERTNIYSEVIISMQDLYRLNQQLEENIRLLEQEIETRENNETISEFKFLK